MGVRTSKGCRKYGITELRNLAASSGMTDLWKNGITEAASRGNTEAQSAEMRIRGKPKNRIHGYLEPQAAESLMNDGARINKILITITAKVRKCLSGGKE